MARSNVLNGTTLTKNTMEGAASIHGDIHEAAPSEL